MHNSRNPIGCARNECIFFSLLRLSCQLCPLASGGVMNFTPKFWHWAPTRVLMHLSAPRIRMRKRMQKSLFVFCLFTVDTLNWPLFALVFLCDGLVSLHQLGAISRPSNRLKRKGCSSSSRSLSDELWVCLNLKTNLRKLAGICCKKELEKEEACSALC